MRWLVVIALVACGAKAPPPKSAVAQPAGPVLYDRIGRMDAIKGIVKDFVEEQLLKGTLAPRFSQVNAAQLEDSLSRQLCELSGGPCKYVGKSMREAHAGMPISEGDFAAFVAALQQSLAKFQVEPAEQNELLALVKKHHDEIVAPQ
jgi:hemoglobin